MYNLLELFIIPFKTENNINFIYLPYYKNLHLVFKTFYLNAIDALQVRLKYKYKIQLVLLVIKTGNTCI